MGTKSRETIYGASIRAAAERAAETRKDADRLACEAWNKRMLGFQGPPQPSPALGGALNAGYRYLEVKCLGCNTHQTVALDIVRRPKTTAVHELERYMRCKDCSQVRGYPYKRSHLVRCARPRSRHAIRLDVVAGGAVSDFLSFVQSPDPTDPITTWTDTRQIS
jgi:hypothetical protein